LSLQNLTHGRMFPNTHARKVMSMNRAPINKYCYKLATKMFEVSCSILKSGRNI
jgi:hypothetical protein